MLCFKCIERRGMTQCEANVVQPFDQAKLAEGVHLKARLEALRGMVHKV